MDSTAPQMKPTPAMTTGDPLARTIPSPPPTAQQVSVGPPEHKEVVMPLAKEVEAKPSEKKKEKRQQK